MPRPIQVYISHSMLLADMDQLQRLRVHLSPLVRSGRIQIKHRESARPGLELEDAVRMFVGAADIFIPMLSADWLADPLCHDVELECALDQRQLGALRIWPIRLSPVQILGDDSAAPLPKLVGFPAPHLPPMAMLDRDRQQERIWTEVVEYLIQDIEEAEKSKTDARSLKKECSRTNIRSAELGPVGHRFALVIGVNAFVDAPSLRYGATDAKHLTETLQLLGYKPSTLYDMQPMGPRFFPTRQNIESELAVLCNSAAESDFLFVHIGTHGQIGQGGGAYLLAQDSRVEQLERTAIPVKTIEEMLLDSRARRIVLSLDACHAGIVKKGGTRNASNATPAADFYRTVYDQAEGFAVIAACTAEQLAYEDPVSGFGVYTRFLIEALEGKPIHEGVPAPRVGGVVTIDMVRNYVLSRMREWCVQNGKAPQEPNVRSQMLGDLILADYRSRP